MKRIVFFLLSTITVVVLLFAYRTSTQGATAGADRSVISSGPDTSSSTESSGSTESTGSGSSSSSSSGSGSRSGSSSGSTARSKTVKGTVVQTRWGPVQVQITVKSGKVTKVSVLQYPTGNRNDEEINSHALPILIQETIDKQSANIDMVSGATITSQGYTESLQAALDKAGL